MPDRGILIFSYDGSFDGMLSMVFESFVLKTLPSDVYAFGEEEPALLKIHTVETNFEHARRVERATAEKLGGRALNLVKRGFLYDEGGKELAILRFLWKGFHEGKSAVGMIADKDVNPLFRMATAVSNEQRLLMGFTRFSDANGALVATIHPKHFVLPLLKGYFCARLWNETFMIYDETHGAALVHSGKNTAIVPIEELAMPSETEDAFYRELWKSYYSHISIASRYNPTCRMAHMPKRFWADMPEVRDELESGYRPELSRGTAKEISLKLKAEQQSALAE